MIRVSSELESSWARIRSHDVVIAQHAGSLYEPAVGSLPLEPIIYLPRSQLAAPFSDIKAMLAKKHFPWPDKRGQDRRKKGWSPREFKKETRKEESSVSSCWVGPFGNLKERRRVVHFRRQEVEIGSILSKRRAKNKKGEES